MTKLFDEIRDIKSGRKELRSFGLVMGVAFGLLAAFLFWKARPSWPALAGLSAFFFAFGLALPKTLRPVQKAWMTLALLMGFVMTRVILSALYYGVVTPIGFVLRLTGKRPLERGPDAAARTYWVTRDNSRKTRESYENQF